MMAGNMIIKNGIVYDPLNGVKGEKKDIMIKDGIVVSDVPSDAKEVDAAGKLVVPGGVEMHSHIAGPKLNAGRAILPNDFRDNYVVRTNALRALVGHAVPTNYTNGVKYTELGFTTVFEPAMAPLDARHTFEELEDTPNVDKASFPVFGNNWFVFHCVQNNDIEMLKAFVMWMMTETKGYAVKIVNPCGVYMWAHHHSNVSGVDDVIPEYEISPRQVLRGLCQANEELGLPHTIHVHANMLGRVGNVGVTLDTLKVVEDMKPHPSREQVMHLTHLQFNCFAEDENHRICSGGKQLAEYVNSHPEISVDLGQVILDVPTCTMTGDGPAEFFIHKALGPKAKWINGDVELECGGGIVPVTYKSNNPFNAIQWAIGLEAALTITDPWRVIISTDHPNGGPAWYYPRVFAWLMSKKYRDDTLNSIHSMAADKSDLAGIDREYTWEELMINTRAAPAKLLGLKEKGHLGAGAHGDVAIYPLRPEEIDPTAHPEEIEKNFWAETVVKDGRFLVKNGMTIDTERGRTYLIKQYHKEAEHERMLIDLKEHFDKWYTVTFKNYSVQDVFAPRPEVIPTNPIS
jgi:formylmethanofuran dehydrogenase subunit A